MDIFPEIWHALKKTFQEFHDYWPHMYAVFLSMLIALLRAMLHSKKPWSSLLEAVLCGCITLMLFPVLDYFGLDQYLAVALGGAIAFLGVDWFGCFLTKIAKKFTDHHHNDK